MSLTYLPYPVIREHRHVAVVDCNHPSAQLTLSHWRGAPQLPGLHDDTSTGIVLNALAEKLPALDAVQYVTNNHWDIDGFLGVWAMLNPESALANADLLRRMAELGDFRELQPQHPQDDLALRLVCWLNAVEADRFYAPFDAPESPGQEAKASVAKYEYFLEAFAEVLANPEAVRPVWEPEYRRVKANLATVQSEGTITDYPDVRLRVVRAPHPLHYYAFFAETHAVDMVLSIYPDRRYELEQKYTTWVDVAHRPSYPRADLRTLAAVLSQQETAGPTWHADAPFDTGPLLRIAAGSLTKAQRFDHPSQRPFMPSSLTEEVFLGTVLDFFRKQFAGIQPKINWTWVETRSFLGN